MTRLDWTVWGSIAVAALLAVGCGDDAGVEALDTDDAGNDETGAVGDDDDDDDPDAGDDDDQGICGDGSLNAVVEECDGNDFGMTTCQGFGAAGGSLTCTASCTIDTCSCDWDDGGCEAPDPPMCGNFVRDFEEECDGNDYGTVEGEPAGPPTCEEALGEGFFGEVICTDCAVDTSGCGTCGDGVVDERFEACEPGAPVPCSDVDSDQPFGEATCADDCTWNLDACLAPSANVIVSELMIVPLGGAALDVGEWIEIHNLDAEAPIDLQACEITSSSGVQSFAVEGELVVEPLGYATFGRGSDAELGFSPDHPIPEGFNLANDEDSVQIVCDRVVLDEVVYGGDMTWPMLEPGVAIATTADATAETNDAGDGWCSAPSEYDPLLFGTPGAANDCL